MTPAALPLVEPEPAQENAQVVEAERLLSGTADQAG